MKGLELRLRGGLCVNHVKAMRDYSTDEESVKHKNCDGYNTHCENYKPIKYCQIPIRQGVYACQK